MREFCGGDCERDTGVVLGARRGRALLGVLGRSRIRAVKELKSGRSIRFPHCFAYSLFCVVLHENDEATVYMRSLKRLWRLLLIYVAVILAALSADTLWEGAAGLYARTQELILRESDAVPEMFGAAEKGIYEGRVCINSRKRGITFANRDEDGVRFGYVVYADGVLFESLPCVWQVEGDYTLALYGRLPVGEHELSVDIYCYREENTDAFDILRQKIIAAVEE